MTDKRFFMLGNAKFAKVFNYYAVFKALENQRFSANSPPYLQ